MSSGERMWMQGSSYRIIHVIAWSCAHEIAWNGRVLITERAALGELLNHANNNLTERKSHRICVGFVCAEICRLFDSVVSTRNCRCGIGLLRQRYTILHNTTFYQYHSSHCISVSTIVTRILNRKLLFWLSTCVITHVARLQCCSVRNRTGNCTKLMWV